MTRAIQQIPAPPSSAQLSVSSLSTSTHSPHKRPSSATVISAPTATATAVSPLTNGSSYAPASMPSANTTTSPSAQQAMQPNKSKATLQLVIATLLSLFGIALLGAAFVTAPPGEIHSSVLIAEVMTFAGALFGIDYHYRR